MIDTGGDLKLYSTSMVPRMMESLSPPCVYPSRHEPPVLSRPKFVHRQNICHTPPNIFGSCLCLEIENLQLPSALEEGMRCECKNFKMLLQMVLNSASTFVRYSLMANTCSLLPLLSSYSVEEMIRHEALRVPITFLNVTNNKLRSSMSTVLATFSMASTILPSTLLA